jgi:hypothetical protein
MQKWVSISGDTDRRSEMPRLRSLRSIILILIPKLKRTHAAASYVLMYRPGWSLAKIAQIAYACMHIYGHSAAGTLSLASG